MQLPLSLAISSQTELIGRNDKSASEPSVVSFAQAASSRSSVISSSAIEQADRPFLRRFQPPQAEIVSAPFHEHGGEFVRHDRPQQRNVLLNELFLQRDGVRANRRSGESDGLCRARFVGDGISRRPIVDSSSSSGWLGCRRENRRHQIRKTLPHAGAGLDNQMPPPLNRRRHRLEPSPTAAAALRSCSAARQCVLVARESPPV